MSRPRVLFLASLTSSLSLLGPTVMAQPTAGGRAVGLAGLGGNLLSLATHPAVQSELQLTEEQKARLKAVVEKGEQQRQRWLEQVGLGRAGDGRGRGHPADPEPPQPLATMVEARQEMQKAAERSIARIFSKAQYARIRQIQLQIEGPNALLRPEMQECLNLGEDQVAQIRELMQARRQAQRATRDARNAWMKAALDRDPAIQHPIEPLAPGARDGARARGVQDGRNGRMVGQGTDPADREARDQARRRIEQDAASRKQMAAFRTQDQQIETRFYAALHSKVLTRRQSQAYRTMLGAPFDPTRPGDAGTGGESGGDRRGTPDANTASADGDPASAAASRDEASSQPRSQATMKARRRGLREQRGLGTSDGRR